MFIFSEGDEDPNGAAAGESSPRPLLPLSAAFRRSKSFEGFVAAPLLWNRCQL
jgi:hypothetical protein